MTNRIDLFIKNVQIVDVLTGTILRVASRYTKGK